MPKPDPPPTFESSDTRFPDNQRSKIHSTKFGITEVTSYILCVIFNTTIVKSIVK